MRIFEIEQEAMSPPWSYESFEEELSRNDSFFIVATGSTIEPSPCIIASSNTTEPSPCVVSTSSTTEPLPCVVDYAEPSHCVPRVCGYAIIRQVGDDGELLKIAVDKTARGNGIGDLLMEAVLDHTEENGFKAVFLEVRVGNITATRLYEKHGFKSVRIRKDYYDKPFEDAIVMVRGDMW